MSERTTWIITTLITWIIYAWLLGGCTVSQPTPLPQDCDAIPTSPMPADLPAFLEKVYPPPESEITLECYQKNLEDLMRGDLHAVVKVKEIVERGDHLDNDKIEERIRISVDTIQGNDPLDRGLLLEQSLMLIYDNEGNVVTSYPGPRVWVLVSAPLGIGKHTATIQVDKTSGAILEYNWTFTIVP